MARRVKDAKLESRAARDKLKARAEPYYRTVDEGLHVGYRKGARTGVWVLRHRTDDKRYNVESIAKADDTLDADGGDVLTWWQAVDRARAIVAGKAATKRAGPAKLYTVGDALNDYLAKQKARSKPKAFRETEITVENLIRPIFDSLEVAKLTKRAISDWHNKLATTPRRLRTRKDEQQKFASTDMTDDEKRRRKSTANRILTVLKAALNQAFNDEHVSDDKAWRKVKAFESVDSARVRYLEIPEAQRLVNAADESFGRLVQAALQTGCRYGELTRMKVADYHASTGTVAVYESKTGKPRHIVLTEEGQQFFTQLAAGRAGDALMLAKAGGMEWGTSHQSRPMLDACKIAKISPPVKFHELRHTWASLSIMGGMPLMVVAKNLGHADTRMVEKHYGHMAQSYVANAVRSSAPRFGLVGETNVQAIR